MCHMPSRVEPVLLMDGMSHTATGLTKAVTSSRSRLWVAHTSPESAAVKNRDRHPNFGRYNEHPPPHQPLSSPTQWQPLPRPSDSGSRSRTPRAVLHG